MRHIKTYDMDGHHFPCRYLKQFSVANSFGTKLAVPIKVATHRIKTYSKSVHPLHMGVSKNRGTPKWMTYNGKPY